MRLMANRSNHRQHYTEILETLTTYFPVPTSNPIMDGYFVHTISRFLDQVDSLKSAAPLLGAEKQRSYEESLELAFPDDMSSIEGITRMVAD